jgi:hypothetical protein
MADKLTPLQRRTLALLAGIEPRWTLTGGGALAAVHLGHRPTRDLDLFWHGLHRFDREEEEVVQRLREAGLSVTTLRTAASYRQLRVASGAETVVVDLVADPVATIEPPMLTNIDGATIQIDTPHEILVNKLCALLGRTELRDLVDVRALLDTGGEFLRGLSDAPRKDGGFSPLTLAWLMQGFDVLALSAQEGWSEAEAASLDGFRRELVTRLTEAGRP